MCDAGNNDDADILMRDAGHNDDAENDDALQHTSELVCASNPGLSWARTHTWLVVSSMRIIVGSGIANVVLGIAIAVVGVCVTHYS